MTSSNRASSIRVGSYQLFERIGEGGTAHVHRAVSDDGRTVAVKLLAPQAELDDEAARARFEREIRTLSELRHPNVVALVDHGVDPEIGPYLVTELLPGKNLRELIGGMPLCPEAALLLLQPIASALAALHDAGLVHRDLKPENAIASPDGKVVLVDLGLAYRRGQTRYTEEGAVVGSVPYMSPEQLEGGDVDAPSDIWSAGVMAYEWLTGKRPFDRERPAEEAAAALVGVFTPVKAADRRASEHLSDLIGECLQRDAARRPDAATLLYRSQALIDWMDPAEIDTELATLIAAPPAYQQRVAGFRIARLKREARVAIEGGEAFAALKLIDRALAYAPRDEELRLLSERAEAAGARAPAPAPAKPASKRRWNWGVIAVAAVAVLAAGGGVAYVVGRGGESSTSTSTSTSTEEEQPVLEVQHDEPAPAPMPAALAPTQIRDLKPIPMSELSNTDESREIGLAAENGEPLVPVDLLGGMDPKQAIEHFDKQATDHPDDPQWRVAQALVHLIVNDRARGLKLLDDVIATWPDDAGAWAAKGFVDVRQGDYDKAEKSLSRAIELDPTDAQSLRNRGILRHRKGRTRDAYLDLTRALEHDPDDVDAMSELAQIYERTERRDDARPLLERIVRARPTNATAWLDLSLIQSPKDALVSIRRAEQIEPDSRRVYKRMCTVLSQLRDEGAVEACTKVLQYTPNDPDALMERGLSRYTLGDTAGALADMDKAVALTPEDTRFLTNRYIVRSHAGQTAAALEDLRKACKLGADVACNELKKQE